MFRKIVFIIFLVLPLHTYSQTITGFTFTGNKIIPLNQYEKSLSLFIGMKYQSEIVDSISQLIFMEQRKEGLFHTSIKSFNTVLSQDSLKMFINIELSEGEQTYLNKIYFSSIDSLESAKIRNDYEYLEGNIFRQVELEQKIILTLTDYEQKGFPFAKVEITSINFFKDSSTDEYFADVYLKIKKERESRIDTIEIIGNADTRDFVILRELGFSKGDLYNQLIINEIPKRLNRLRFFQPVLEPVFMFDSKGRGILQIKIEEKQTNNFDGIVGFVPGQKNNESGYVTGLANITMRNLFGTGRAAAFRWQKIDRLSQELEIKYLEPWVFNFPFNISGILFQKKQDSSYVQRRLDGSIEFLASRDITVAFNLSSEVIIPTVSEHSVFTVFNSSHLSSGLSLKIDTRDDPYAPTEGLFFNNAYWFTQKKISGPEKFLYADLKRDYNIQKIMSDFSIYFQTFKRQVVALGVHLKELQGGMFEISDLYFLGGTNSLRGYRENQFQGSRILWSNLEYRFLLTSRTFVFSFFDSGYYHRRGDEKRNIAEISGFKIGYGLGLNLETGLGVIAVSFAMAKGESFSEGKIHFGLINEF